MRRIKIAALLGALMMLATSGLASAQVAYGTSFATSITYQNVGTAQATVQFQFYNENTATPVTVQRTIAANAGSSLFVGGLSGSEALPAAFKGSAVMSADQPVVATLVQIAQPLSSPVKNRPLSNGFSSATSNVRLATVLKNKFHYNSIFSIQNAETNSAIDITVSLFNADNVGAQPITIQQSNIPIGAAKYFDMFTLPELNAVAEFNGSATVQAFRTGTSTPANIVGSSMEQQNDGLGTYAFEGVSSGSTEIYVATALCDVFAFLARTSYAVQNVHDTVDANVTVSYVGINNTTKDPVTGSETRTIAPGTKFSFLACNAVPADFTGAAKITSNVEIVAIAKAFGTGFSTAWLGESQGSAKLALPYVRYSGDPEFASSKYQRAFLAVQNVGDTTVSGAVIEYRDKNGTLLGTHALPDIAPGAKANSTAIAATPASGVDPNFLLYFGNPEANPGGGFGGAAIITGPAGSELIGIVRVQTADSEGSKSEDANAIPIS
jgi:hypothetical protein